MVRSSCSNISFTLLHLFAVFALTSRCSCSKADSLSANQSLHDGETLISANKTFELGFFSPVNSANRFVGIWFYGIANGTVVWVGNRNSPLVDTSGSLVINYDGDLIVVDGKGSSSTLAYGSGMRDLKATILDSGNFVLSERGNSSNILWQSFDDPTDTWLPGMKLGFFGQQNRLLTSWTSSDDPSPGDFSFGVDLRSGEQLFIWGKEKKVYWTSGKYIGNPSFTISFVSFEFVYRNKIEIYFTYTYDVEGVPSMFVIDSMGQIQCLTWIKDDQGWVLFWVQPRFYCDVHNACGSFGVCDSLVFPFCSCLTGFIPESPTDWKNLSCTRMASLQCGSGGEIDKFVETSNMVFPLNPQVFYVGRAEECESACLNDCNCTAYAISTNCNLWYGELMNLKVLNPSDYNDSNVANSTIYIRVAASELESAGDKRKKRKILIVGITTTLSFLICCSLFCLMWTRRCRNRGIRKSYGQQSVITFSTTEAINLWETEERESQFSIFDFSRIADATNNFSAENKLGEGGFGPVYKGLLPEGQDIAVKRLAAYSGQGLVEFKNEILLVAKLQHRNLVRLLGCCTQGEEKILVYEYMPNKSLDFFLFDKTGRTRLDWIKRFNIIDGIAQGLLYLHKHSRQRIIHRDLKASNILLDEEMNPKISDFGMARIFGSKETQANTNRVVGTYGYMSPEYAMEGLFSVKSDVFSFGVLLLEIVSGLRNAGFHQKGNSLNLLGHAWELWKEGRWIELVDGSLGEGCPEEVLRCIHVALMCVQENAVDRPTMSEVIAMLSSENASLPDPKQPPFITVRISAATNTDGACSPNVVTVSVPEGR